MSKEEAIDRAFRALVAGLRDLMIRRFDSRGFVQSDAFQKRILFKWRSGKRPEIEIFDPRGYDGQASIHAGSAHSFQDVEPGATFVLLLDGQHGMLTEEAAFVERAIAVAVGDDWPMILREC